MPCAYFIIIAPTVLPFSPWQIACSTLSSHWAKCTIRCQQISYSWETDNSTWPHGIAVGQNKKKTQPYRAAKRHHVASMRAHAVRGCQRAESSLGVNRCSTSLRQLLPSTGSATNWLCVKSRECERESDQTTNAVDRKWRLPPCNRFGGWPCHRTAISTTITVSRSVLCGRFWRTNKRINGDNSKMLVTPD